MSKLKLAFYGRVSGNTQKNENTIERQIMDFEEAEPKLSQDYEIIYRQPNANGPTAFTKFFLDNGFNFEKWDDSTAIAELMHKCQRQEVDVIYIVSDNRIFRGKSVELRGKVTDILVANRIGLLSKSGVINTSRFFLEINSSVAALAKSDEMIKCQAAKITWAEREGRPPSGRSDFGYSD